MKLKIINRGYGCFLVVARCNKCNKILFDRGFSYSSDKIGIGNKEAIYNVIEQKRQDMEINYCCKCGHDIKACYRGMAGGGYR